MSIDSLSFCFSKGYRVIKIYSREGVLVHTSEYIAGLEKPLAWMPSGALMTASESTMQSHLIIFIERNGLKHGQFKLPHAPRTFAIWNLSWTYDSSVLMIFGSKFLENIENEIEYQEILFYTTNNYHWYLKQKLRFDSLNYVRNLVWNETDFYKLHLITNDGHLMNLKFHFVQRITDRCDALVIDSNRLNISDFQTTVIPSPLFTYSLNLLDSSVQINHVFDRYDHIGLITSNQRLIILKLEDLNLKKNFAINKNDILRYNFEHCHADFRKIYCPIFRGSLPSKLLLPLFDENFSIYGLVDRNIINILCDFNCDGENQVRLNKIVDLEFICETLSLYNGNKLLMTDSDKKFHIFDIKNKIFEQIFDLNECIDGLVTKIIIQSIFDDSKSRLVFYQTTNQTLYFNQKILMKNNCNNFAIYRNQYILFTTLDNQFYCWPLKILEDPIDQIKSRHPGRMMEKGSKLLTISSDSKVIVYLPRGNLEAFYPKLLLLDRVNSLIKEKNFLEAFNILRRNRLNLNYVCDYDFEGFLQDSESFIEQLLSKQSDWLCLFLFELSSINSYELLASNRSDSLIPNKMNRLCNRFIEIFQTKYPENTDINLLKSLLLCNIKKEKSEIVECLRLINSLQDRTIKDQAIKFLTLIIDIEQLLNEALGAYDFELFRMIASRSDKDPREYNQMLRDFEKIEDENYRKYQIDLKLKRYAKALNHLAKCPDRIDDVLELIQTKHLFREAIEIYQLEHSSVKLDHHKKIWNNFGDYLLRKNYYFDAAIAYKRSENYLQAFRMYSQCSEWNEAILCAKQIDPNRSDEYRKLLRILSDNLVTNRLYRDASYINETLLNDPLESFRILLLGHEWSAAIRVHQLHQLDANLLEKSFKTELIGFYEKTSETIQTIKNNLEEFQSRLKELLKNKFSETIINNEMYGKIENDFDCYSDTSSVCSSIDSFQTRSSSSTLRTNRSANRRRHAKKQEQRKYQLRKGSNNEDIQLIYAIKQLIVENFDTILPEIHSLINALYESYCNEETRLLQANLEHLQERISATIDFVWNSKHFEKRLENGKVFCLIFLQSKKVLSYFFLYFLILLRSLLF